MTAEVALRKLLADPLRARVVCALAPAECHLVGGAVRDRLVLGRTSPDWDLIVEDPARAAVERLARALGGRVVRMGADRFATFRLVLADRVLDVCDRHGMSLGDELLRRDLTINSIAIDLTSGELNDPVGGLADIDARILRANAPERFTEDPVRVLRLVRFALDLPAFTVEPGTTAAARTAVGLLDEVAPERVRSELDSILGRLPRRQLGELLAMHGLYPVLWKASPSIEATGRAVAALDRAARRLSNILHAGGLRPQRADLVALHHALLLSAADADTSGRLLDELVRRGYLSRAVADVVRRLLPPIELPSNDGERRLFIDRFGRLWPVAAGLSTGATFESFTGLVSLALAEGEAIRSIEPLLDGNELGREFGLVPGPAMGELLDSLRREQVRGKIQTVDDARRWIEQRLERESG